MKKGILLAVAAFGMNVAIAQTNTATPGQTYNGSTTNSGMDQTPGSTKTGTAKQHSGSHSSSTSTNDMGSTTSQTTTTHTGHNTKRTRTKSDQPYSSTGSKDSTGTK